MTGVRTNGLGKKGGVMKFLMLVFLLVSVTGLQAVTAEQLYGTGYAYHAHTSYGLRLAGSNS